MLVGRWVQQTAIEKNRNRLLGARTDPGEVTLTDTGAKISATALDAGACYRVAPGQPIPVRSKLISEAATLGLEWINGESEAQTVRRGQLAPSGAINYSHTVIDLEAVESWEASILCLLLRITPKEQRQPLLERFLRTYIGIVLVIAAAGFAAWWWSTHDLILSLQVLISILVVSCPCAAGVAIPLADEIATSRLRNAGVFVREQSLWERALRVRAVLFDKTGTLTLETMGLRNPEALAALTSPERAMLLALVRDNFHPVSCCLREALLVGAGQTGSRECEQNAGLAPAVVETVGFGLETTHEGAVWRLGRPGWGRADAAETASDSVADCEFSRNGTVLARLRFGEEVRADAADEVGVLHRRGLEIYILSGDRPEKVRAMATRLGLDPARCHGGMTPNEKAGWVRAADPGRDRTLTVGDGANDSLAFNESFCTGTPAVDRGLLEHKADFYFLGRGLNGVRQLLETATLRHRAVRWVVAFAILYNAATLAVSLAGAMSPLLAAILMPVSSLISIALVFAGLRRSE